jgi:hypothetical protein
VSSASIANGVAVVVEALESAGLRTAVRAGDITPPVFYIQIGATTGAGVPLAGGVATTLWVFYIPIRGIDNLAGDSTELDAAYFALEPLTIAELTGTRSSLTVGNETYPAYRLDCTVVGNP